MRLLIDECIDERLRRMFPGHDCQTARFANLAGLKNGRLIEAAEDRCGNSLRHDESLARFRSVSACRDVRPPFDRPRAVVKIR